MNSSGEATEKKVLMIAYFFPPLGGSGVQRTLKFAKYLPRFSIQPVVSTVRRGHNFAYDESLLREIPELVKVYRSNSLETLWLRDLVEKLSGKRWEKASDSPKAATTQAPTPTPMQAPDTALTPTQAPTLTSGLTPVSTEMQTPDQAKQAPTAQTKQAPTAQTSTLASAPMQTLTQKEGTPKKPFKQRIFNFIDDYLFVPDSKVRWLPFGFLSSLRTARKEQVAVLFSSSYPYTVHLIALLVQKFYRKPWIADFRDPWVGNKAMAKDISYRQKADAWLEGKVVKNASYVINVTPTITEMYKERYPEYREKFVTITNGFDPADFTTVSAHSFDKFTLIHTGILSKDRSPAALVKGLELLIEERPELRERLQVLFVGYIPEEFVQMFRESPLAELFEVRPYVPHSVCLDHLAGAQLQLLIFDDSPETKAAYSGKIFDYIGTQKPVLGILPEGVAADLIREKGIGTVVPIGDASGVKEAVAKHYDEWLAGEGKIDSAARCAEFSRVNLAGQLASLIESLSP
ncbi:MAG: glycosyltransferase family protein [Desulfitobacteriaceae bacterium]